MAGKALYETMDETADAFRVYAMHDAAGSVDEAYFPASVYKGFAGKRLSFVLASLKYGRGADTVLLSHVNLLLVGYLIKLSSPKTKLVLMAHGIEVWEPLHGLKKKMFAAIDLFLPVSRFTAGKLQAVQNVSSDKIKVLNNCLDPFLKHQVNTSLVANLRQRYRFTKDDFILLTVTRLKYSEQYKGYDKVVQALKTVRQLQPNVKYLIVGKYDAEEKARLDAVIAENGLDATVVFTGFAKDEELSAHFALADAYVMPSTGEGFGIVFIEALFYGLPVIAGNVDGSVDALAGGEFGLLVNPYSNEEIVQATFEFYNKAIQYRPDRQNVMRHFGYETYKHKLRLLLSDVKGKKSYSETLHQFSIPKN